MTRLLHHLRLSARTLRREPRFATAAVLTLALGIGLATAVFTVADGVLLRPMPVVEQDRLVVLAGRTPDGRMENWPLSVEDGRAFARATRALSRVSFFGYEGAVPKPVRVADVRVGGGGPDDSPPRAAGEITRLRRALVAGDYFAVLGATPVLGRALRPEDDVAGAPPVVVLSHRAWRERFGGARDVVGRRLTYADDGAAATVVGVMPAGLDWPRGTEMWAAVRATVPPAALPYAAQHVLGRLAPGATAEQARAELTAFFRRDGAPPPIRALSGVAHTLPSRVVGDTRPAVLAFAAASALLLVITCVNVANLLLVRGLARVREVAVRLALGGGRRRLVAERLVEHALLAAAGGALGVLVAAAAVRAFVALAPAGLPRLDVVRLDLTALGAAVAITAVTMLLFAVVPALRATRVAPAAALRSGTRVGQGRGARLTAEGLVAGQLALALLVVSAAVLLGRSFVRLERADLAFDASRLVVAELALRVDRYPTPERQLAALDQVAARVAALPGVRAVSPVVSRPFSGNAGWDARLVREGQSRQEAAANPMLNMEVVAPDYFAAFELPARRGRTFTADDRAGAPAVVVLSEAAARTYFPDGDAVGRRLVAVAGEGLVTVVGVVPDTRYRELREARATIYFPLAQSQFPFAPTTLAIRTGGAPETLVPALARAVAEAAPGVELASAAPFAHYRDAPLAQPRLNALLLAVFAGAALLLAAVGLFGVMATTVRQRTRELGVRQALGATPRAVARLVLGRGLAVSLVGAAAGVGGALALNQLLAGLLYEVSPTDGATLAAAALALLVVGALASALPARAGARVDPVRALRAEG
jgi:predicted permease